MQGQLKKLLKLKQERREEYVFFQHFYSEKHLKFLFFFLILRIFVHIPLFNKYYERKKEWIFQFGKTEQIWFFTISSSDICYFFTISVIFLWPVDEQCQVWIILSTLSFKCLFVYTYLPLGINTAIPLVSVSMKYLLVKELVFLSCFQFKYNLVGFVSTMSIL